MLTQIIYDRLMKTHHHLFALLLVTLSVTAQAAAPRTDKPLNRCGWFENPTPANAWLTDKDGEWIIGVQGGHQADGDWPEFKDSQWIKTNVHYGYGCACIKLVADTKTHEVSNILSARALPLKQCRKDRALKEPH